MIAVNDKRTWQDRWREARTLRDDIKVRMHLAGRELRDEWAKVEKRLPDPAKLGDELRTGAVEVLDRALEELRRFRERIAGTPPPQA